MSQKEVIEKARKAKGIIMQGRFLSHNYDQGSAMNNEAMVYIEDAIKNNDTYYNIAWSIAKELAKKTLNNTLPDNWFVFVSDAKNGGVQYAPAGYAFVRIKFDQLEIAVLKTAY